MKPKDLKSPFSWEERRPLIQDQILFVPEYYHDHASYSFPGWESVFGSSKEVKIEFCTGNGKWILERAEKERDFNWVACEIQFERVRKIWSKLKNTPLPNVLIVAGEAETFATHYVPESTVSEIFINFPDPWPKKKHEKNRLIKPTFITRMHRMLKSLGKVLFVTDDEAYRDWTLKHFLDSSLFTPLHPSPHYILDIPEYGTSYFDTLWRQKGKKIYFLEFAKR